MDGVTVSFGGLDSVQKALDDSSGLCKELTYALMQQAAQQTYDGSQRDVPVLSGGLKASGQIIVQDNGTSYSAEVDYSSDHAWYVELGTIHMAAQPYVQPNYDAAAQELEAALQSLFS